tara:strand:- start:76232 stop:76849 length:618 start_codon:yes stop_codon:yes gene_type:complete
MKLEQEKSIISFAKTICGQYSNKLQAQKAPKNFAHINIFFRPIPWLILEGPGLYSEQSYDYDPWNPYRQAVHSVLLKDSKIILTNYQLLNPIRVAGAGLRKEFLNEINPKQLSIREGCDMYFKDSGKGNYSGQIKPGNNCIISRGGKSSYLVSNITFNMKEMESEDQGNDLYTNKKIWGSDNGPFCFNKIRTFNQSINEKWLLNT